MHELSLMEQTLAIALEQAQAQGATKIHRLRLRIGQQSGVIPEAIRFAFDVVVVHTAAAGAILEIEEVPILCYCDTCRQSFQPEDWIYQCPQCDRPSHHLLQGKEMELTQLEIS